MGITAVKCRGRFWGYTEGARSANTRNPLFKAGRVPEPTRGQPSPAVRSSAARQVFWPTTRSGAVLRRTAGGGCPYAGSGTTA